MCTRSCHRCKADFASVQASASNYCPKCISSLRFDPNTLTQAPNRQPLLVKDMNEAVHLFALLIKRIRDVGNDVLGYTYPCQDQNQHWLQVTPVCFAPTPSCVYQDQEVSDTAGVDFQPRFTPEHCYPFRLVLHGKLIKDFLLHPELVSVSEPPTVVCWWKSGPIKTSRIDTLGNSGDRTYEGFVTIDSNRMKPPIKLGRPYRVREFLLGKDVLRETGEGPLYLRLDRKRMELEDRPRYLDYMTGSKSLEIAAEELFCERRLLEFVRELDVDSMDEDKPRWTDGDSLFSLSKAYLSDLSVRLKAKLAEVRLDQPPLYRICCPEAHFTPSSFLLALAPEAPLRSRALYIVEVKGRETRLLSGVTLGLFERKRKVGLSLRHIRKGEWNLVYSFWPVTELDQYIGEFESLPKVLSHMHTSSQSALVLCELNTLLKHLEACPRLSSPCSLYKGVHCRYGYRRVGGLGGCTSIGIGVGDWTSVGAELRRGEGKAGNARRSLPCRV